MMEKERLRPVSIHFHTGKGDEDRCGYFHGWSNYADETGNTPVAIIEWLDGQCTDVTIEKVRFTDRQ